MCQITAHLRKLVHTNKAQIKFLVDTYHEMIAVSIYLFRQHSSHFALLEDVKSHAVPNVDTFLSEQKYIGCTTQMTQIIYDLRKLLLDIWGEAQFLEKARMENIKTVYEEIVSCNSYIWGQEMQQ